MHWWSNTSLSAPIGLALNLQCSYCQNLLQDQLEKTSVGKVTSATVSHERHQKTEGPTFKSKGHPVVLQPFHGSKMDAMHMLEHVVENVFFLEISFERQ